MVWILPLLGLSVMAAHYALLHYYYNVADTISIIDSAVTTITLALAIWGVMQSVRVYPTRVGIMLYSLVVAAFFSMAAITVSNFAISWLPDAEQSAAYHLFDASIPIRYLVAWLICSWVGGTFALQKRLSAVEDKMKKHADTATLLREAELFKLRQQLQPHFLYNSLNSISALTMIEPAKAQEMVGKLSDFLRNSVKRDGKESISLKEELDYVQTYLSIESIRFGNRLHVVFDNKQEKEANIPPFLLQPILENAIKFGLYGNTGEVTITISITHKDNMLVISVTNPYDPEGQPPKGTGFGLKGIQRRLYLLFARNDLLETNKHKHIYTTTLKIPQEHV